jgi:hypothetical protein
MTPPLTSDDTSPQLDTSQIGNEKSIPAESLDPDTTIDSGVDGQHQCEFILQGHEIPRYGEVTLDTLGVVLGGDTPWNLCGETRSYISAHLNERIQPDRQKRDEIEAEQYSGVPPIGLDVEGSQASYADDPDRDGQDDSQATQTGQFVRIPTSSIPQLLSTSISLSAEANRSIQQHLGFGIDETSYPVIRSRQESFAFSVDGDDSVFKKVFDSSHEVILSPHSNNWTNIVKNITQSTAQSFGKNSNMSSSTLASDSPYQNVGYTAESSYSRNSIASPPQNVSVTGNGEPPFDVHHLSLSISSLIDPDKSLSNQQNRGEQTKAWGSKTTQGLLPLHQSNSRQSAVPEVYSAINSLERYNPGSLDNKVILAKARGGYGRQKAFPGVPMKRTAVSSDNSSVNPDCSVNSVSESKVSSAVSQSIEWENNSLDKTNHNGIGTMNEQIGLDSTASNRQLPLEGRMRKSTSSGHLTGSEMTLTSERLEEKLVESKSSKVDRSVTVNDQTSLSRNKRRKEKIVGVFRPSSDAYTPRMGHRAIRYKPVEERASVEKISSTMGTIQRPNFRDALRRVAIILHQHIVKIELRFRTGIHGVDGTGLFKASMKDEFNEENFATPRYKCSIVRVPMARPGIVYSMRKIRVVHTTPTADEIYEFAHQLFKKVQLSSECSIVCLIYVEKLMEVAKVPLVAETWRPIFLCGLLLASKVWQDLSSWNIEFACVYPQFSLDAINRLELSFLKFIKWDLYISSR